MRASYNPALALIELIAAELEGKMGQTAIFLGGRPSFVRDNQKSDQLFSSCVQKWVAHAYERYMVWSVFARVGGDAT